MSRRYPIMVLLLLLLFVAVSSISAQSAQVLSPETAEIATLSELSPINVFSFSGNEGDLAQIQLTGIQPDMNLTASLQSPGQRSVGISIPSMSGDGASLSARLPETGVYTVLIGGNFGNYLISLSMLSTLDSVEIIPASSQPLNLSGTAAQVVHFSAASGTALTISAADGSSYQAAVFDGDGTLVGTVASLASACFAIPAGDATYTVLVNGTAEDAAGTVSLALGTGCGETSAISGQPNTSATATLVGGDSATRPAATQAAVDPNTCTAVSSGTVNVRSGAGTNFSVIGSLTAGNAVPITGTTNVGWVQVQLSGGLGFVSQDLVRLNGACQNLPLVAGDGSQQPVGQPTQAGQATATQAQGAPTATQQNGNAPTATYTATTEAVQPSPTYTPTQAAQIAPPDSNYALSVPLDGNASVSDAVSYPEGDTEDVVSYSTTGLNNSVALPGGQGDLTIVLNCSGTGTEFIVFRIDGQNFSCGQTFTRRVNADSDTGAVRITATGGQGTYVQWSLAASLPRVP